MTSQSYQIPIAGMDCANCARGIERHFERLGLKNVFVDYSNSRAYFPIDEQFSRERIESEVTLLGYQVGSDAEAKPFSSLRLKFWVCFAFTVPLLLHMVVHWQVLHDPLVQLLLTLPVYLIGSYHFGRSSLYALRNGTTNMDVLIFIGSQSAFWYSLYGLVIGEAQQFLFFETAATIITTVLLGNYLEARALKRTTSAIEDLAAIQPQRARRIVVQLGQEQFVEIPSADVELNERLLINTGERIPTDGTIYWGSGAVDESMITGESAPRDLSIGEPVIGGTILTRGSIKIRTSAIGANTVLANIIRLVQEAQGKRPEIQRLADTISHYFVPIVIVISLLTFLISFFFLNTGATEALIRSVAVLVVACPCAMGLATPTAIVVGLGKAARAGILIRGGTTLEKIARGQVALFDKTGTLTVGRFKVASLSTEGVSEAEATSVIVALERHSNHPIAKALCERWSEVKPASLSQVQEERGIGMTGSDESGARFRLISTRTLDSTQLGSFASAGDGIVLLKNDLPVAHLTLRDAARPDAADTVRSLRELGIESHLLSGDSLQKCRELASEVGIQTVHAEKLPEQKLTIVDTLEQERPVIFIGDGINDAPALARASVGVSLSEASQVAVQSAQVILLQGALLQLPRAVRIARGTVRTIKQNLFWAFLYNTLAIPVAAAGYLSPIVGALAMAFSDLIVIGNSIRFRYSRV